MDRYKRVFVIVLDSLGIGAMPDSENIRGSYKDNAPYSSRTPD